LVCLRRDPAAAGFPPHTQNISGILVNKKKQGGLILKKITIDLGNLSLDDILASKTGNSSAELEIIKVLEFLKSQDTFDVKVIGLNGNSEQILKKAK
jgi:hypothetical protein